MSELLEKKEKEKVGGREEESISIFEEDDVVVKVDGLDVLFTSDLSELRNRFLAEHMGEGAGKLKDVVVYTGQKQCILSG